MSEKSQTMPFACRDRVLRLNREKFRLAFEERRANASVILVSHNEQTIRRNCDMAAILHDGDLTLYEDLKDALHNYKVLQTQPTS